MQPCALNQVAPRQVIYLERFIPGQGICKVPGPPTFQTPLKPEPPPPPPPQPPSTGIEAIATVDRPQDWSYNGTILQFERARAVLPLGDTAFLKTTLSGAQTLTWTMLSANNIVQVGYSLGVEPNAYVEFSYDNGPNTVAMVSGSNRVYSTWQPYDAFSISISGNRTATISRNKTLEVGPSVPLNTPLQAGVTMQWKGDQIAFLTLASP